MLLSSWLLLAMCGDARAEDPLPLDDGLALVGLIVDGEEKDAVDALVENGAFLLPLESTFAAIGAEMRDAESGKVLATPIGTIRLPADAARVEDGMDYIPQSFLEGPLNTKVRFDESSYAVVLEPPWNPGDKLKSDGKDAPDLPELEPDVVPPAAGVTSVHGDVFSYYNSQNGDATVSSQIEVNGHAGGGVWRARYSGDLEKHELAEYAWLREINENTWVALGRQQTGVHPLIDTVDMTGAQVAWSNRPEDFEQIEEVSGTLLSRTGGTGRRFVGDGPPGGRVELLIDGLVVAETLIDVNGLYKIENPLLGERRTEVELRVFEPLSDNQIDSINLTVTANRLLAPKGSVNVIAGVGAEGNFLDTNADNEMGPTGFVRARYAPFDDITLEGAAVYDPDDGLEGSIGAAVQFGRFGSAYAAAGMQDDGTTSFEGLYYGSFGKVGITARTSYRQTDGKSSDDRDDQGERADDFDHYVEASYEHSARLRFGAIARHNVDATFALPFVTWAPHPKLRLSARPNRTGEYRVEARAKPFEDVDLLVFYEGAGFARVAYNFDTELTGNSAVSFDVNYDPDEDGFGLAAGLSGSRLFGLDARWRLRAARSEMVTTASFGISHEIKPGVSVYADGGMSIYDDGREDEQFGTLGLSFDLGVANGNITAAPRRATSPRYGRLAGRIVVPDGIELTQEDIAGANVVVDGQPLGRLDASGDYWLPRIPKGAHTVRLEADTLPIDLVVDTDSLVAEVAPGAVTVANFDLAIEVGAAGRITGPDGKPVKGVPLQIVASDGEVIARGRSNMFGLFRLDGLRPGTYTLRAVGRWDGASRPVTIGTEYAFGTDMQVDKPAEPESEADEAPVTRP